MAGRRVVAHQPAAAPGQTGGGFVKHACYYWLLLAEGHPGCKIPGTLEPLSEFVAQFAEALNAADSRRPMAVSPRSGRVYQPGIGPHPEDRAVDLIVAELNILQPDWRHRAAAVLSQLEADLRLLWGDPPEWAVEIKMFRPNGDNGKPDDTAIKDILSPFVADRSAVADCRKIADSDIAPHRAILIYGFDDNRKPLLEMIAAFETLARTRVTLGQRRQAPIGPLVHPVHRTGAVFGWEVTPLQS